jgi:hypothetical protein
VLKAAHNIPSRIIVVDASSAPMRGPARPCFPPAPSPADVLLCIQLIYNNLFLTPMARSDKVFCTHCRAVVPRTTMQEHRAQARLGQSRGRRLFDVNGLKRKYQTSSSGSDSDDEDADDIRPTRRVRRSPSPLAPGA